MTDCEAFEVGKNIAVTPGKVVFQNDLHAADPIHADHGQGREAAAADHPALDQQVLHPRSEAAELLRQMGGRPRPDRLHRSPGSIRTRTLARRASATTCWKARSPRSTRSRQATGEKSANVIGYCLGGTLLVLPALPICRPRSATASPAPPSSPPWWTSPRPASSAVFIDEEQLTALEDKMNERGYLEGARDGDHLQHAARQRPDLVLRHQQLPAGQGAVPVRPALLELRFHAHAGGDAQLLSAQHVSAEPADPAGRHRARRRDDRPRQDRRCRAFMLSTREDHIAPWKSRLCARTQTYQRPGDASCWPRPAISPAWSTRRPRANTATGSARGTKRYPAKPEDWLASAEQRPGSWWPEWQKWIAAFADGEVDARKPGSRQAESASRMRRDHT